VSDEPSPEPNVLNVVLALCGLMCVGGGIPMMIAGVATDNSPIAQFAVILVMLGLIALRVIRWAYRGEDGRLEMTDPLLDVGRWVETHRKARKLTRGQLAARAGVAVNTVYLLETGANTRMSSMCAVLGALDATILVSTTTQRTS
jgi:DNA-binding XRE family transcriptional regulator